MIGDRCVFTFLRRGVGLQNRRNFFLRILGEQMRTQGEREARVVRERKSATRAGLAFASVRLNTQKITPVLQASVVRTENI